MKKYIISTLLITVFVFYVFYERNINLSQRNPSTIVENKNASKPVNVPTSNIATEIPPQSTEGTPANTGISASVYKDGTYTGNVADAYYGNVQVRIVVSGGNITDVQAPQQPGGRLTSIEKNLLAIPKLKTETIVAQSAQIDTISGATDTSNAFIESLSTALSQAKK